MKFVLFVEGHTEKNGLPFFIKKYLDAHLSERVGIKPVRYNGWREMHDDTPKKAKMHLNGPSQDEIIAVIALMDLYGPTFYPGGVDTVDARYKWAKKYLEERVGHLKFKQHFAVHETEAWLLSSPEIFPSEIQGVFPGKIQHPEDVNFDEPPAKLLDKLYKNKFKKNYKKVTDGKVLFGVLDPQNVYQKCPYFQILINDMLQLARNAGL